MTQREFNLALTQNESKLKLLARKFTTDSDEALDLVQETFLKALKYKDKFRENINISAWLYTIMRNTFINQFHKKQRYKTYNDASSGSAEYSIMDFVEDNRTPDAISQIGEKDIESSMKRVDQDLIAPFRMYIDGYKYIEIAEETQLPLGTIKNKIFRARKELARELAN